MFTTKLFNNCNSFALLQKMPIFDGIFDSVLMVSRNYLWLVYSLRVFVFFGALPAR